MIVATAGHVDHGKTTLVKSLTGIDADRLPEEKKRGMTIDIGFAYWPRPQGDPIGFVDVPGHERFVHNMLCGLPGIDAVLLVVAADDGAMPQTLEHLTILDLLGVKRGLVALTKVDRVSSSRAAEVEDEITRLLDATSLAGIPIFPVAAVTGQGVEAIAAHLQGIAKDLPPRRHAGNFRMTVDRSFSLTGAGLIVTGTVVAGNISTKDKVHLALAGREARIRGLHVQNEASELASTGQRCALNLIGDVKATEIRRGDWVVAGDTAPPVRKFDARIHVPPRESGLRHWSPVHVHLGASDVTGRLALLEAESIPPGGSGLAQLILDQDVGACHGDKLILRDQSARRTIAGGVVLDVFPPNRGRARPERLAALRAQMYDDATDALAALLAAQPNGVNLQEFAFNRNLTESEADAIFTRVPMRRVADGPKGLAYSPARWTDLRNSALVALDAWHRANAEHPGVVQTRLLDGKHIRLPRATLAALIDELVGEGSIARAGSLLFPPGHRAEFNPADSALWQSVETLLRTHPDRPPLSGEIAEQLQVPPTRVQAVLERASRRGLVLRVGKSRFFLPEAIFQLAELARTIADQNPDGRIKAGDLRIGSSLGRTLAVEVLEFFDRTGYTRRIGDSRLILKSAQEVFGSEAAK
jgi:selenocysteine-specific elongation factor